MSVCVYECVSIYTIDLSPISDAIDKSYNFLARTCKTVNGWKTVFENVLNHFDAKTLVRSNQGSTKKTFHEFKNVALFFFNQTNIWTNVFEII